MHQRKQEDHVFTDLDIELEWANVLLTKLNLNFWKQTMYEGLGFKSCPAKIFYFVTIKLNLQMHIEGSG